MILEFSIWIVLVVFVFYDFSGSFNRFTSSTQSGKNIFKFILEKPINHILLIFGLGFIVTDIIIQLYNISVIYIFENQHYFVISLVNSGMEFLLIKIPTGLIIGILIYQITKFLIR